MPAPRLPASWYTAKGACIGVAVAGVGTWLGIEYLGAIGLLLISPIIAGSVSVPFLVGLDWLTGQGQRAYRFGRGRQERWGYCGHDIRGLVDGEEIWLSLRDCETASGLDLSAGLRTIPAARHRRDDVRGLLLDMPAMLRVLERCEADFVRVNRLRAFLERSVWMTRRG